MNASRRALVGALVVVAVVGATSLPMLANAQEGDQGLTRGEPDLEVYLPENELLPGSESNVAFRIANDGEVHTGSAVEQVTTARGVSLEIEDAGPFEVKSGETPIGPIQDGAVGEATQRLVVPEDVEPGNHAVEVRLRYDYTNRVTSRGTQRLSESDTQTVTVRVPDEPRFEVSDVETDVQPGTSGDATLRIENVGTETASDARATITGGGGVVLDGEAAEEVLGDLEPGESTNVTVDAAVDDAVGDDGAKPLQVAFTYEDENGVEREGESATASLAPAAEQSFSIRDVEDTLSVGYDGEIRGNLSNDGPRAIEDAVLIVEPMSDSVFVEDTRFALPPVEAGETAEFRYPTEVAGEADEGPRQVRFTVEYTGSDSTTLQSDPVSERVVVDERRDEFSIESANASVPAGGSATLAFEVTNERPETLSNVDAQLYTDSPLSSANEEAFVDELGPGETTEIRFQLSAAAGTMAKPYPVELDFEYDTESGESKLSDVYQYPVDVESAPDDGGGPNPLAIGGVVAFVGAALGAGFWWRRR